MLILLVFYFVKDYMFCEKNWYCLKINCNFIGWKICLIYLKMNEKDFVLLYLVKFIWFYVLGKLN